MKETQFIIKMLPSTSQQIINPKLNPSLMESEKSPGEIIGMFISLVGLVMILIGAFSRDITVGGIGGLVSVLGRVVEKFAG